MSHARIPFAFPKQGPVYAFDSSDFDENNNESRELLSNLKHPLFDMAAMNTEFEWEYPIDGDELAHMTRGDMAWSML